MMQRTQQVLHKNPLDISIKHKEANDNVGYIEETGEFVSNTCIREKQILGAKFTVLVCKKLKSEF